MGLAQLSGAITESPPSWEDGNYSISREQVRHSPSTVCLRKSLLPPHRLSFLTRNLEVTRPTSPGRGKKQTCRHLVTLRGTVRCDLTGDALLLLTPRTHITAEGTGARAAHKQSGHFKMPCVPIPRSDQVQAGGPDTERAPALRGRWLDALGLFQVHPNLDFQPWLPIRITCGIF